MDEGHNSERVYTQTREEIKADLIIPSREKGKEKRKKAENSWI